MHLVVESDNEDDKNMRAGVEADVEDDRFDGHLSDLTDEIRELEDSSNPDTGPSTQSHVLGQLTHRVTPSLELKKMEESDTKTIIEKGARFDDTDTRASKIYAYAIAPWQASVSTVIIFAALVLVASGAMYYTLRELRRS